MRDRATMNGRRTAWAAALFLAAAAAQCGEEYQIPWDRLKDAAQRYLAACVSSKAQAKMAKKFKERTQQRVQDTGWSEDTAMRTIMLDWAAANRGKLERKENEAVAQACFYLVVFLDKGYLFPGQMRAALTPNVVDDILEFLEKEIKAGEHHL
ncbi:MAG: hypothetical protein ABSE73_14035 [Planctomycetota bacterium]